MKMTSSAISFCVGMKSAMMINDDKFGDVTRSAPVEMVSETRVACLSADWFL